MLDLKDKTILVTGASSGIGFGTALNLLECGAKVLALGRDKLRLDKLFCVDPNRVSTLSFDLLDFNCYREIVASLPMLDGIVHSAGIVDNNPMRFFSLDRYKKVVDVNQTAPTLLTAELLRANKINQGGSIVFVASINGTSIGIRGSIAYGASKAALVAISRVIALEVGHKRIRSNCVSPGTIETEMIANLTELTQRDRELDRVKYPLGGRFGTVQEAADAILFLLSNSSSFITGQNLVVDGGYTAL